MIIAEKIRDNIKKSFSLLELSICILISGILVAVSIISVDAVKQSRAQAIISQFETYRKAINNFYNDYGYLPGDLPNAQNILSSNNDTIDNVPLDGYGRGYLFNCVSNNNNNNIVNNVITNDGSRVWSQLGAAGYINKRYASVVKPYTNNSQTGIIPGYNMPSVAYSDDYEGVWNFIDFSRTNNTQDNFLGSFYHSTVGNYNNSYTMFVLQIVSFYQTSKAYYNSSNVNGKDCYQSQGTTNNTFYSTSRGGISNELLKIIDNKIDDGKPLTGSVLGHNSSQLNSYMSETLPCVNIQTTRNVSSPLSVLPTSNDFIAMNIYTDNTNARCVGVFLLPEFTK